MFYEFDLLKEAQRLRKEVKEKQREIKKQYNCEESTLDFNPRFEHIEKSIYKEKECFIIVPNKEVN